MLYIYTYLQLDFSCVLINLLGYVCIANVISFKYKYLFCSIDLFIYLFYCKSPIHFNYHLY